MKQHKKFFIYFFLILTLFTKPVNAQQIDSPFTPKKQKWPFNQLKKLQEGNLKIVPIPAFSVSPERGLSLGLILEYFFNTDNAKGNQNETRLSNAYLNFQYSTRNQLVAEVVYSVYTKKEKYFLQGAFGYKDFYERYWTFSQDTVLNNQFRGVEYQQFQARGKWVKKLKNQLFFGFNFNVNQFSNITFDDKTFPTKPIVSGINESFISGIGPLLIIDKRDNQFSPQKGWFSEVGFRYHDRILGSNFSYVQYFFDVRRYIITKPKGILALQATGTFNSTNLPFLEKIKLGNDRIMRGYFAGRFRDNNFSAAQIEYRYPIGKSFIISAFASAGQTAETVQKFSLNNMQSSIGGGLRYLANKEKLLYIRLDAGYTKLGNWGFYLNLGDAF